MTGHQRRAGSASALFGLAQYGIGALVVPLGGLAGVSLTPAACLIAGLTAVSLLTVAVLRHHLRKDAKPPPTHAAEPAPTRTTATGRPG
jgi:hypothetical protein